MNFESIYTYRAKVKRIYDGDTLVIDLDYGFNFIEKNVSIRLYGVNTPEIKGVSKEEKESGYEARDFVRSLLPVDSTIYCRSIKDKLGGFRRKLMVVYYYDYGEQKFVNLNKLLVELKIAQLKYVNSIEELN